MVRFGSEHFIQLFVEFFKFGLRHAMDGLDWWGNFLVLAVCDGRHCVHVVVRLVVSVGICRRTRPRAFGPKYRNGGFSGLVIARTSWSTDRRLGMLFFDSCFAIS
jgi:hypothetical protein